MSEPRLSTKTPILPDSSVSGGALSVVAAVMCYLACLALGASLIASAIAQDWLIRASSQATVQIVETETQTAAAQLPAVMAELSNWAEIAHAQALEKSLLVELLEPWLGTGNVSDDLPLPILIAVTPKTGQTLPTKRLGAALRAVAPGARLDIHQRWRNTVAQATQQLHLIIAFILALITIVTAIVVLFATRAGLNANHGILQILHLIGAQDTYITRHFEKRFLAMTAAASGVGWAAGCTSLYVLAPQTSITPVALFVWLALVPVLLVTFGWIITRQYVLRELHQMY